MTTRDAAKTQKPTQDSSSRPAYMWLRLASAPVANTSETCTMMNITNQHSTAKCSERATWMLKIELIQRNRVDSAGDIPSPVMRASGAATNTVRK